MPRESAAPRVELPVQPGGRVAAPSNGTQTGRRLLGQTLVKKGLITASELRRALEEQVNLPQDRSVRRLGSLLVEAGVLQSRQLAEVLAELRGVRAASTSTVSIEPAVRDLFPLSIMQRFSAVPLCMAGRQVVVAMADPHLQDSIRALQALCEHPVQPVQAPQEYIARLLASYSAAPQSPISDRPTERRELGPKSEPHLRAAPPMRSPQAAAEAVKPPAVLPVTLSQLPPLVADPSAMTTDPPPSSAILPPPPVVIVAANQPDGAKARFVKHAPWLALVFLGVLVGQAMGFVVGYLLGSQRSIELVEKRVPAGSPANAQAPARVDTAKGDAPKVDPAKAEAPKGEPARALSVGACGDGILEEGEVCDDGNKEDGDGCRADCKAVECRFETAYLDPKSHRCFWRDPAELSRKDALSRCEAEHGTLLAWRDAKERDAVFGALMAIGGRVWVGLSRTGGTWQWEGGTPALDLAFKNEPTEDTACVEWGGKGFLKKLGCKAKRDFICVRPPAGTPVPSSSK